MGSAVGSAAVARAAAESEAARAARAVAATAAAGWAAARVVVGEGGGGLGGGKGGGEGGGEAPGNGLNVSADPRTQAEVGEGCFELLDDGVRLERNAHGLGGRCRQQQVRHIDRLSANRCSGAP